ncbi:MAG: hypothetical protein MJY89_05405 [Bacteroidales bacterium]|nr:hypothetical protein [Bacteroidales bacterium]
MKTTTAKHVYKFSDIAISGGIIIAGTMLSLLVPSSQGLGICIILMGLCILPFLKTGYRIPGQKEMFSHKDYLLPQESKSDIAAYIEGKSETLDIDPFKKGGLLLEQYYLRDGSRQFVQLFDYSTGIYSAQCELTEIDKEKLEAILKYQ